MKVITIALTLFFLNLSMVIVSTLDIYSFNIAAEDKWREEVEVAQEGTFDPEVGVDAAVSFGFGDFVTGFQKFRDILFRVTFMGETLKLFGVDSAIANTFSFAGVITYILGISQFIANRSTKGMQ